MADLRQSPLYANYLKSIGWEIEKNDNTYICLKKIPLLGYFAKIQRPVVLKKETIDFIEKKYKPFQFAIEPLNNKQQEEIQGYGFKKNKIPSLPTKTLQIDLTKSEEVLMKGFSSKTRYNIRLSIKRGVEIIESENIIEFTNFWRENFEKKVFALLSQQKNIIALSNAFKKDSHILLAKKDNKTIAVLLLFVFDQTAYYMFAASSDEGRCNFAPTLLTYKGMLLAKKDGCNTFDFDGIYDGRFPIKSWKGFTKFKKSFGGYEIDYPGRFVKTRSIIKI